jgi:hypothetical protein
MNLRHVSGIAGTVLGVALQAAIIDRFPHFALIGGLLGAGVMLWAWTRPSGLERLTDAVLEDAHRCAVIFRDEAGADALRAEIMRRREVRS